jgi:hypothetical protein
MDKNLFIYIHLNYAESEVRTFTSTDQAITHSRISPSHMVDETITTRGCAMSPTNADGCFNHV